MTESNRGCRSILDVYATNIPIFVPIMIHVQNVGRIRKELLKQVISCTDKIYDIEDLNMLGHIEFALFESEVDMGTAHSKTYRPIICSLYANIIRTQTFPLRNKG